MMTLAIEREPERGGGIVTPLLLRLANHPRQDDVDLLDLPGRRAPEILARRADGAHRAEMREGMDGLGAGRLEEQLGDFRPPLVDRLQTVRDVPAVGIEIGR